MAGSFALDYIRSIEEHSEMYCEKIRKLYLGIIKPIVTSGGVYSDSQGRRWTYSPKPADKYVRFCETFIRQTQAPFSGKPLSLVPYQKALMDCLLGITDADTGLPRFKKLFLVVGRKNGKTTLESSFGLYHLLTVTGAEVYCAATTQFQARKLWDESVNMIQWSPDLQKILKVTKYPNPDISFPAQRSHFYALSNNPKKQDSLNVSLAVIDEVHELPREVFDRLETGTSSREYALIAMITTAGYLRGGLFDDEYENSKKILDGLVYDPAFLPVIYELDGEEEMWDESKWVKANPTVGECGAPDVVKNIATLRDHVNQAKYDLNFRNEVMVKDFNIIGVQGTACLTADEINGCDLGPYTAAEIGEEGSAERDKFLSRFDNTTVLGGYDLAKIGDFTAFDIALFDKEKKSIVLLPMAWITESFLHSPEAKASKVPFDAWIRRGLIRKGGEMKINYSLVSQYLDDMFSKHGYYFQHIMYDAWGAAYLTDDIESRGWSASGSSACQVAVRQGYKSLSLPTQELLAMIRERRICTLGNPVIKWELSNCMTVSDANGNIMLDKAGEKRANKIDNIAALVDIMVGFCEDKESYL